MSAPRRYWAEDLPSMDVEVVFAQDYDTLASSHADLLAALQGVVRVADRNTDEFNAARAAIRKAKGTTEGEG